MAMARALFIQGSGKNQTYMIFRIRKDGQIARTLSGAKASLRSCPFCGCHRIKRIFDGDFAETWPWSIQCVGCGVLTPPYRTPALAARAWNQTMPRRTRLPGEKVPK